MYSQRGITRRLELLLDVLLTECAFICAYVVKMYMPLGPYGGLIASSNYPLLLLLITIIWYVSLDIISHRSSYRSRLSVSILRNVFYLVSINTVLLVLCMYLFKISDISRILILFFFILDILFLHFSRWGMQQIIASRWNKDIYHRYILIIGSRATAKELIRMVANHPETSIQIVGCVDLYSEDVGNTVCCDVQIIGAMDDLRDILLNRIIDEVLIAMPMNEINNSEWYLSLINTFGITIRIIPYWYIRKYMSIQPGAHDFQVERFLSEPALVLSTVQEKEDAMILKSVMDYTLAAFILFVTSPIFLIFAVSIKLCSSGPVFYKQLRCGQYGRKFHVYKFRTMVKDADKMRDELAAYNEADGPVFKMKRDPRIIPYVGAFLRKVSLDELPQFINVLRGEMSIVGPRPPIPEEVEKYELWQRRRLSMKPGITCTWQIQPQRNAISFDQWMSMDLDYIDRWSLWLDITLILKTLPAIVFARGR